MSDEFQVSGLERVPSPALLVWPDRVEANIDRMISMAGGAGRLRPHVKTHKMDAVVRLQLTAGINKFKAATIAEVEMCLAAGAPDVLLAYPLVGPNRDRLVRLAGMYTDAQVQFLAEDVEVVRAMDELAAAAGVEFGVFIDLDCGMHRTGLGSRGLAVELARAIESAGHLRFAGVHAYDGHVRAGEVSDREADWSTSMEAVDGLLGALEEAGLPAPAVVGGGSPSFGLHAEKRGWQCSPGTTLFWDGGYGASFPDLPFEVAAAVITRVISKPGEHRLCLDLGHKAIASEGPLEKRVRLLGLEEATFVGHSEEHLVLEVEDASSHARGKVLIGIPNHICPTVALHQEAYLVRDGEVLDERWEVTARNRRLSI